MSDEFKSSLLHVVAIATGLLLLGGGVYFAGNWTAKSQDSPSELVSQAEQPNDLPRSAMYADEEDAEILKKGLAQAGIKYTTWVSKKNNTGYTLYGVGWEKSDSARVAAVEREVFGDPCRTVGGESLEQLDAYKKLLSDAGIQYREFYAYKVYWLEWSPKDDERAHAIGLSNQDPEACGESSNNSLQADRP